MTARDLFGVVLRSIGVVCIIWGLDSTIRFPLTPLIVPAGQSGVFSQSSKGGLDYAGGTVMHLNPATAGLILGGGLVRICLGIVLLIAADRIARLFYRDH